MIKNRVASLTVRLSCFLLCALALLYGLGLIRGGLDLFALVYYSLFIGLIAFLYYTVVLIYQILDLNAFGVKGHTTVFPRIKCALIMALLLNTCVYYIWLFSSGFALQEPYEGFHFLNILVHAVLPGIVLSDWFLFDQKHHLKWYDPLLSLFLPLFYLICWIVSLKLFGKEIFEGRHIPYYFFNNASMHSGQIILYCTIFTAIFLSIGYLLFLADQITFHKGKLGLYCISQRKQRPAYEFSKEFLPTKNDEPY